MLAPIVVFSYNRPDHLSRTLAALTRNELASESVLYIYCDGPNLNATEEQVLRIAENRKVAHNASGFKEVNVVEREHNIGLKNNIVGAVTEIVNTYGRVITLEDDVITSVGFLRYMNDALDCYEDEDHVMHISAYMWPHKCKLPETFFYKVPYPGGGWATWKRAWRHYNDDAAVLYEEWKDRWEDFDAFGGNVLSKQLIDNYNGTLRTWFVKWYAVMLGRNAFTLYPRQSLTNNIGFDNSGTNCLVTNKFDIDTLAKHINVTRRPLKINGRASRIIFDFYQGHWYNRRRRKALLKKMIHIITFWK